MEFLKNIFGDKALTYADFTAAVEADKGIKLVNLKDDGYVAKNKLTDKIAELQAANDTIADLKGKLQNAEKVDVEALQKKIADYEQAEQKRADDEKAAKEVEALRGRFAPLKGEHKYINEYTENAMFDEFRNALSLDENKGKSDSDIYAAITKDKNIYENPNQRFTNPPVGKVSGTVYKSKNDIMSIKDSAERIKAIQENPNLFRKEE